MAAAENKKSFWEIFAIVVSAIAAVLGGLSGVAALIIALKDPQKTEAAPAKTPPPAIDDAAQRAAAEEIKRAKAEAEAAKAELARIKAESAKAKERATSAEQAATVAQADIERQKAEAAAAKMRTAELEKELAESANGSSKKNMAILNVNKEEAKKFLNENKGKEGVKTTISGLQYKVIKRCGGPKPTETDTVKVHYRGTLLDGTEFDSSYKNNEPAHFRLDRVIPGWFEALQLMGVGSIFELYIPPELAYGDEGAVPVIQPGSLLKFEVELRN